MQFTAMKLMRRLSLHHTADQISRVVMLVPYSRGARRLARRGAGRGVG